jgi:hypothetical protein
VISLLDRRCAPPRAWKAGPSEPVPSRVEAASLYQAEGDDGDTITGFQTADCSSGNMGLG